MPENTWILALTSEGAAVGYGDTPESALAHARHLARRDSGEHVTSGKDFPEALEAWIASLRCEEMTLRHGGGLAPRTLGLLPLFLVRAPEHEVCQECGCTSWEACEGGCSWVDSDLCSACEHTRGEEAVNA